ncbi:hypothetical protein KC19_12G111700 [Ceratodon purpureus]|uniref:WDR19 WD40 repeat domain-containing protein n=1 Tax=Ceratodon purpureus TaxID=3225 RepID=A0A8T0GA21_CERPU|nr:hypothetical protein KC19_12G111700 [Ceratodon purpureus]
MVSCVHYTSIFLTFGTQSGSLHLYYIGDNSPTFIDEFVHIEGGIIRIWPNQLGTRIIFEDERKVVYFYNPLKHQVQQISTSSGLIEEVNWNEWDPHIFSLTKQTTNYAYIYTSITKGVKKLPHTIDQLGQSTKSMLKDDDIEHTQTKKVFEDNLSMIYFDKAWLYATILNNYMIWETLVGAALKYLELQVAIKACEESKNVTNLYRMHEMEEVEEQQLLHAHISKFLQEYINAFVNQKHLH